ncbi:MAG: asparagine synthase C-terminal domain-containing protein [Desulfobacterales bacterium]
MIPVSHMIRWNNTRRIKTFFFQSLKETIGPYNASIQEIRDRLPEDFNAAGDLTKAQYLESTLFFFFFHRQLSAVLPGDRVAMGHAVETRPPFWITASIEFMARVPSMERYSGLNEKYLLKKVFKDVLPKNIVPSPEKSVSPYSAEPVLEGNSDFINNILGEASLRSALDTPTPKKSSRSPKNCPHKKISMKSTAWQLPAYCLPRLYTTSIFKISRQRLIRCRYWT